jgi:tetratricopeptide (TPR) repeat protein
MSPSEPAPISAGSARRGLAPALGAATAVLLGVLAYHGTFRAPFVFDDLPSIVDNPTIRTWWPPWAPFLPPALGTTVGGRPVANATLALDYALGGLEPWWYHATNLLIHLLGGLTLFAVVRRTLRRPLLSKRFGGVATPLAGAGAVLWLLHPLQTEAVTYVIQRVESLMALFYLLTLYLFVRSLESARPLRWQVASVAACLLGMATKEVMATAPFMVLLHDRTFVAGTFREAWKARRGYYLTLTLTWVPLVYLVAATGWNRGGSAGFGSPVSAGAYWLTQFGAVLHYLRLAFDPHPLVFDYGTALSAGLVQVLPGLVAVVALGSGTLLALSRRRAPALGFLGAWFLVILAPSCLVPVATQTMAEHRMYLPLAAVAVLVAAGAYCLLGRRCWVPLALIALALGFLTERRNEDYRSALRLWSDTVRKRPDNPRAHCALGYALYLTPGGVPAAIKEFEEALRLQPRFPDAENDLAMALASTPGHSTDAIARFQEAVRLRPGFAEAHYNLGTVLAASGRTDESIAQFEEALRLRPDYAEACNNLGNVLCASGRIVEGIRQLEAAVRIRPDYARAHFDLGNALVQVNQIPEAIAQFEEAVRIEPGMAAANNNLGMLLCRSGRMDEGVERLRAALQADPEFVAAHYALAAALWQAGRREEAAAEYEEVLRLRPNDPAARKMLDQLRAGR